jgi:hypothetical protein
MLIPVFENTNAKILITDYPIYNGSLTVLPPIALFTNSSPFYRDCLTFSTCAMFVILKMKIAAFIDFKLSSEKLRHIYVFTITILFINFVDEGPRNPEF